VKVADQIKEQARLIAGLETVDGMELRDRHVWLPDESSVSFRGVALSSLHRLHQHQIIASGSSMSYESPPPFAAQFVEVAVDVETGQVVVERALMVADIGRVINPITAVKSKVAWYRRWDSLIVRRWSTMRRAICLTRTWARTISIGPMRCRGWRPFLWRRMNRPAPLERSLLASFPLTGLLRRWQTQSTMQQVSGYGKFLSLRSVSGEHFRCTRSRGGRWWALQPGLIQYHCDAWLKETHIPKSVTGCSVNRKGEGMLYSCLEKSR